LVGLALESGELALGQQVHVLQQQQFGSLGHKSQPLADLLDVELLREVLHECSYDLVPSDECGCLLVGGQVLQHVKGCGLHLANVVRNPFGERISNVGEPSRVFLREEVAFGQQFSCQLDSCNPDFEAVVLDVVELLVGLLVVVLRVVPAVVHVIHVIILVFANFLVEVGVKLHEPLDDGLEVATVAVDDGL